MPGHSVTAKLAFTPDSTSVVKAEELVLFWTQEFVGTGNGSLPDRIKKTQSESSAVSSLAGLTLAAASIVAALAF